MKFVFLLIACSLPACVCQGSSNCAPIRDLLRAVGRLDVIPSGADFSVETLCGPTIDELGGNTNLFFDLVRAYCTNLCGRIGVTNRDELAQCRAALNILRDYDAIRSKPTFVYCATNCQDVSLVFASALCYSECASSTERHSLYREIADMPLEVRTEITRGIIRAFSLNGGSGVETNQMTLLGLNVISDQLSCWRQTDKCISVWWPAYATSSNRYVAAQLAREANPPCVSSNYLARVIAGLEALPPGTMQMLSTNHLGQAWQE